MSSCHFLSPNKPPKVLWKSQDGESHEKLVEVQKALPKDFSDGDIIFTILEGDKVEVTYRTIFQAAEMKSILLMLPLMLFVGTRLQADEPLPPAPAGFAWQHFTPIKSALLKPDGWFYKESTNANTQGFFINREEIDKVGTLKQV